jgi:hypothetical protein
MLDLATIVSFATALGISAKDLLAAYQRMRQRESKESLKHWLETRAKAEETIQSQDLGTRFLRMYYPDIDLSRRGLYRCKFAVDDEVISADIVSEKSWLGVKLPLENEQNHYRLVSNKLERMNISEIEAAKLLLAFERRNVKIYNEPIFSLQEIHLGSKLSVSFSLAHYFDYKFKFGLLEDELVQALVDSELSLANAINKRDREFQLRNEILPDANAVAEFSKRICAGGANILLAFRRPAPYDDFIFLIKKRSQQVSSGRGVLGLVPTGCHQPITVATASQEVSLTSTIYREIFEELFGGDEVNTEKNHLAPDWYMDYPQLDWFRKNKNQFVLEVTSFGLNLLEGTYEFGILFAIEDPSYWSQFGRTIVTNFEVLDYETPPISTRIDSARLATILRNPMTADVSVFSLAHGLHRLKDLHPSRVKLPRIEFR